MRRAVQAAVVVGAVGVVGAAHRAWAEPWAVTMETGAESDSNVSRVETAPAGTHPRDAPPPRISTTGWRGGARLEHKGQLAGGGYALATSGLARMVRSNRARLENVMLFAGELRWLHALGARPVALGLAATAADASAMFRRPGARTFRNLGGDGVIALGSGEDRLLTLAIGWRDFTYKPVSQFSWYGPVVSARIDATLWQAPENTPSLELSAQAGFEARTFRNFAFVNICRPGAACFAPTTEMRSDRFQRASVELNWTGSVVATLGYQLVVIDSNSFGQSLVRHRVVASLTTELLHRLFASATATLQLDQYPDGLFVHKDDQRQELTLEDDRRSSLQLRLARELCRSWSLEARGAIWRDLDPGSMASFRREVVYGGLVYTH